MTDSILIPNDGTCKVLLKEKRNSVEWRCWNFLMFKGKDRISIVWEISQYCRERWLTLDLYFNKKKEKKWE